MIRSGDSDPASSTIRKGDADVTLNFESLVCRDIQNSSYADDAVRGPHKKSRTEWDATRRFGSMRRDDPPEGSSYVSAK